jgi:hypothetical protein
VDSFDPSQGPYTAGGATSVSRIFSNGTITLQTGSTVKGDVRSTQGNVILHASSGGDPGAVVNGNVTAGTTISQKGTVTGTITAGSPASALVAPLPASCSPFSSSAGISGTFSYSSSTGDLVVNGPNTATLANGTYCFHSITLNTGGTLRVNGPVVVNLTGKLTANLGSIVNNTTNAGGNLQVHSSYTGTDTGVALSGGGICP